MQLGAITQGSFLLPHFLVHSFIAISSHEDESFFPLSPPVTAIFSPSCSLQREAQLQAVPSSSPGTARLQEGHANNK